MTNDEILAAFVAPEAFPEAAIVLAGERREELAPLLIEEIMAWAEDRHAPVGRYYYVADIAIHLLADWGERRAFKPALALLRSANHEILGDTVTENAADLLARLYDGDWAALTAVAFDENADEYVRDAAMRACGHLTLQGVVPRAELCTFLQRAFESMVREENVAWMGLISVVSALVLDEFVPQVKVLFETEVADPSWMSFGDFLEDLENSRRGRENRSWDVYGGPIDVMRGWRYVNPGEDDAFLDDEFSGDTINDALLAAFGGGPALNEHRDLGRNDPCFCGSGKKFKKCCLPGLEAARA